MPIVDELRQDVTRRIVVRKDLILLCQSLPQVLGLGLELFCHLLLHSCCYTVLEDLMSTSTSLGTNLQEVGRNSFLSYRSQSVSGDSPVGCPQLLSLNELT